jgi:ABC-2 type transport system permease protein
VRTLGRALRGEILQLRKWPAVWCLAAAMPVYLLLCTYLPFYLMTVTASPEQVQPSAYGVSWTVSVLAPGQMVRVVSELGYGTFGPVLALVLGALVVGTGFERGTTRFAALTGAGWLRVLLAQGVAVCAVLVVSVLATYGVAAGSGELAHVALGSPVPSTVYSLPPAGQLAHGMWVAMLICVCYGMIGCALAAIVQSPGAAIILGLFLIYGIEELLNLLGVDQPPIPAVAQIALYEPSASVGTLTSMFGQPGGGGAELTTTPAAAAHVLGAWAVGSALVFITVGSLRHKYTASRQRLTRLRTDASVRASSLRTPLGLIAETQHPGARAARSRQAPRSAITDRWPTPGRVVLTVRSELFVMLRWPAIRALLLVVVVYPWLLTYVVDFVSYWLVPSGFNLTDSMPALGAGQMLPELLINLSSGSLWTGYVPLLVIGAWAGGSIWTGGQLRTSLIQRQRRSEHVVGQCLALILLTITATALSFALAVASVKVVALLQPHLAAIHTGGKYGTFPAGHAHHRGLRGIHAWHWHIRSDRPCRRHGAAQRGRRSRRSVSLGRGSRNLHHAAAAPAARSASANRRGTTRRKRHQAHHHHRKHPRPYVRWTGNQRHHRSTPTRRLVSHRGDHHNLANPQNRARLTTDAATE